MHCSVFCFCNEPWHFLTSPVESSNDSYLALDVKVGTIKESLGNIPENPGESSCPCEAGFSGQPIDLTSALCGAGPRLAVRALWQPSFFLWMYECSQRSWFKVKSLTTWEVFLPASAQSEAKQVIWLSQCCLLFEFHKNWKHWSLSLDELRHTPEASS